MGTIGARDIYTMKISLQDIDPPARVTSGAGDDSDPTWSPNGQKVAFSSDRSGDGEIWVVWADGTNASNLTSSPASEDLQPDWQPLQ